MVFKKMWLEDSLPDQKEIANQCLRRDLKNYHFIVKKNSWTLTVCHVLKNFQSPRLLTWRTSVSFTTWPWHHLRRRIKQHWDQATFPFPVRSFWEREPNFAITDKLTVCAGLSKISKVAPEGHQWIAPHFNDLGIIWEDVFQWHSLLS